MFDTSKLASRVFSVAKAGKFNSPFVDTLRFPTKSANPELTASLEQLFSEVNDAAEILLIDLTQTGGTFKVDYKQQKLYSPSVREHQGEAVITWGKAQVPLTPVLEDKDNRYVSVRESGKQFELVVIYNNKQTVVPLFLKKGKTLAKSAIIAKLNKGQLADILAPAIVYTEPLLNLRKFMKDGKQLTLSVKSLTVAEGGEFGASGIIEFHGVKDPYKANSKAVERLLAARYDTDETYFSWGEGELEFTIKGVKSGKINGQDTEWLDYSVLDRSVCVDDFEYTEDDEVVEAVTTADDDASDFEMEEE
jgi:hypothetical protein